MQVTFLGTHGFRDQPQTLGFIIDTGETRLLVECGQYVDLSLTATGIDPETIDGVYVSHNHVDHAGGVKSFVVSQAMRRSLKGGTYPDHTVSLLTDTTVSVPAYADLKSTYPLLNGPGMSGIRISEIDLGRDFVEWRDLQLATFPLTHAVPTAGLIIKNAERTVIWWADGIRPAEESAFDQIDHADLMVAAVLGSSSHAGVAAQLKFLTASDAAEVCKRLSARLAVVHHFFADDEPMIRSDAADAGVTQFYFGSVGQTIEI
jgi:ribonuclease BN (tRNA processing enzyme)